MRRFLLGAVVFGTTGLLGPILRYAVWPFLRLGPTKGSPDDVVFYLVLILWPGMLGANAPTSKERAIAALVSIGWNIFLFAMLGLVMAACVQRRTVFWLGYGLFCCVVSFYTLAVYAGYSLQSLNVAALLLALMIYAVAFGLLRVAVRRSASR
jgi:hypothetical protein